MEEYLGLSSTNSTSSASPSGGGVRGGSSSLSAAEGMMWEQALLAGEEDGSVSSTFRLPDITHLSGSSNVVQPTEYYQGGADALPEPWELFSNSPFEMTDYLPFTVGFDHTPSCTPFGNRPMSHHVPVENHSRITNSASGGPPRNIGVIGEGCCRTRLVSDTHMANAAREAPPRQVDQGANVYVPHMRVAAPSSGRPPRSPHVAPVKSHDVGTARNGSRHLKPAPVPNSPQLNRRPLQRLLPTDTVRIAQRTGCLDSSRFPRITPTGPPEAPWSRTRLVSMPAIGNVGAFMSTPESFLDFPAPGTHGGSATVIYRYLPARPQSVPRANPTPSAPIPVPHRHPGIPKSRPVQIPDARSSSTTLNSNQAPVYPTNAALRNGHH